MTYSLAAKGLRADQVSTTANLSLSDADAGRAGNQMQAMMNGTQFLYTRLDGSQVYCTIDASRSVPGGPIYILPVGP